MPRKKKAASTKVGSSEPILVNVTAWAERAGVADWTLRARILGADKSAKLDTLEKIAKAHPGGEVELGVLVERFAKGAYVAAGQPGRGRKGEVIE